MANDTKPIVSFEESFDKLDIRVGRVIYVSLETIAVDKSIRELKRLKKAYGGGRWRKMKGIFIQLETIIGCPLLRLSPQFVQIALKL